MPDIRDLVDPAELIGVVRELTFPRFALEDYLPNNNRDRIDWSTTTAGADNTPAASVRAFDAPAPIGSRPGFTRASGSLPPISQKIVLTEGESLMLRALQGSDAANDELIDAIYDDAARMVKSVHARVELARGDVLTDGVVTIAENGQQFSIDYGVPSAHKVTVGTTWANPAADALSDQMNWLEVYAETTGGLTPGVAIASTNVIGQMLRNTSLNGGTQMTFTGMNEVLVANGLPPVTRYDVQITNANGTSQRVIPTDRLIWLPDPDDARAGETQFGTTREATKLSQDGILPESDRAGVIAMVWETEDPVQTWTKGTAIALPVLHNPNTVFSADVNP